MNQTNVLLKSNFIAKKSQNPTKSRIINSNAENLLNTVVYGKKRIGQPTPVYLHYS